VLLHLFEERYLEKQGVGVSVGLFELRAKMGYAPANVSKKAVEFGDWVICKVLALYHLTNHLLSLSATTICPIARD
jgi:hypothetical protein